MTIKAAFPHRDRHGNASFRSGQKEVLMRLQRCVQSPQVDFVFLEAPTGFGKTAVAGTIASHFSPAHYLTEQKIHQDQLAEEFPHHVVRCKGQRNYNCGEESDNCLDPIPDQSCLRKPSEDYDGELAGVSSERGELYWRRGCGDKCPYFDQKTSAMGAPISCLNYSYFFNETYYSGDFGARDVLICDEAHNIGNNMRSFLTFRVDDFIKDETGLELLDFGQDVGSWEDWILNDLKSAVEGRLKEVNAEVLSRWEDDEEVGYELLDSQDKLDEILCNINRFGIEYDDEYFDDMDWAVERSYEDGELDHVSFEPVTIAPFADRFLFSYGDTVILMSATILDRDTLCRQLGLQRYKDRMYEITFSKSPFDAERRPIFYYDAPSINHDNKDRMFPKTCQLIDGICNKDKHRDEKGIIHSVSYANEEIIRNEVSPKTRRRLVFHEDKDREGVIEDFKATDEPKILCSPGIYEGVDLKYDMSRFQIIPKVPYLSLGSRATQLKKEKDPQWYDWRTAIRLIQSFGRSMRARDDRAATYIVDGSFANFYQRNQHLFPDYISGSEEVPGSIQKGDLHELLAVANI